MVGETSPATSELILAVSLDGDIGGGISHAGQAVALAGLVIVQEGLVALVNAAFQDLASTAGVRQLQASSSA